MAISKTTRAAALDSGRGPGFAFMQFTGLLVFSCYWRQGGPLQEFEGFLSGLDAALRGLAKEGQTLIVAGDFNAKSTMWGSAVDDRRREILANFAATWELWPENVGSVPTFAVGDRSSVVDVTFARLSRGSSIRDWRVRDDVFSDSDHNYIVYSLSMASSALPPQDVERRGWRRKKLDAAILERRLKGDALTSQGLEEAYNSEDVTAEMAAKDIIEYLTEVSDAVMPRGTGTNPRRSAFWWSEEKARLRKSCVASLRACQRADRRGLSRDHLKEAFRVSRKALRLAIRKAQESAWRELWTR